MTDQTLRIPSYDEIDNMVEGDPLKLRDLAWDLASELERVRRDLAANERSEDARLAIAEEKVRRRDDALVEIAAMTREFAVTESGMRYLLDKIAATADLALGGGRRG